MQIKHFLGYYWRDHSQGLPFDAIKAGVDKDGGNIYLGRAIHNGETLPAKIVPNHRCAYVSWDGKEHRKDQYEVCITKLFHCRQGMI